MVKHSPQGSALSRARMGEYALWTPETYLLAVLVDVLNAANWQRGGGKGRRPKPLPRPKDPTVKRLTTEELRKDKLQSGVIGTPMPLDELKRWVRAANGR